MSDEPITLAQMAEVANKQCGGNVIAYHLANSHCTRVKALEEILEYSYAGLIQNRHLNQEHSEDALSVQIVQNLKGFEIEASHDTQTGGHCDIHVVGKEHFLWIGEAKIHSSYEWLEKGFMQLSTRYSTGSYGQDHGEIIIYCRNKNAKVTLETWKNRLRRAHPDVEIFDDQIGTRLWFRSKHENVNSGLDFFTRHRILNLYWSNKS